MTMDFICIVAFLIWNVKTNDDLWLPDSLRIWILSILTTFVSAPKTKEIRRVRRVRSLSPYNPTNYAGRRQELAYIMPK